MTPRFRIVGIGESLYDILPSGQVLGGAPLNVAVQAHQASAHIGGQGVVVSRVGQDALGDQLIAELKARGMSTDYVQTDPDKGTGKVYVEIPFGGGEPTYEIVADAAWDWLQYDPDVESLAGRCEGVCFGSLAQRQAQTRNSIYRFLVDAKRAVRLFDVNVRQNFYDKRSIARSCELANAIKLNERELPIVADLLNVDGPTEGDHDAKVDALAKAVLKKAECELLALTRGVEGTVVYAGDSRVEGEPASYPPADQADAVGAGDACSAGLLIGLVKRWPLDRVVTLANAMGAYVASQAGATGDLPDEIKSMVGPLAE